RQIGQASRPGELIAAIGVFFSLYLSTLKSKKGVASSRHGELIAAIGMFFAYTCLLQSRKGGGRSSRHGELIAAIERCGQLSTRRTDCRYRCVFRLYLSTPNRKVWPALDTEN
ncbi:hypothetical protein RRG08_058133, partial [Elysia crispata]